MAPPLFVVESFIEMAKPEMTPMPAMSMGEASKSATRRKEDDEKPRVKAIVSNPTKRSIAAAAAPSVSVLSATFSTYGEDEESQEISGERSKPEQRH